MELFFQTLVIYINSLNQRIFIETSLAVLVWPILEGDFIRWKKKSLRRKKYQISMPSIRAKQNSTTSEIKITKIGKNIKPNQSKLEINKY